VNTNKSRTFLILVAIAALFLPVAPVMAITSLYIPAATTVDLNSGSMDLDCGNLVLDGGTLNMDSGTLYNVGDVIINSGTINLDSGTIYISGDWSNNGGTVNPGSASQVTWSTTDCGTPDFSINGNSTFYNVTIQTNSGRMVTFQAGKTTTVNGHLVMNGDASSNFPNNLLKIRSSVNNSQSFLVVTGSYVINQVDVKDNNAQLPGLWIDFGTPASFQSIDSGNNYRWFRSGPGTGAPFIIEKIWNQQGDTDGIQVTAHLSCTGAVSTQQNVVFTATTDAILFVYDLWSIPEGQQVDCTITEDVPAGYVATYDCNGGDCGDSGEGVDACFYSNVDVNEDRVCTITNRPLPATVTVTKTWVIEGGNQGFNNRYDIVAECNSRVGVYGGPSGCYNPVDCFAAVTDEEGSEGSVDYEFTIFKPRYPNTACVFWENTYDNVIESDNGCDGMLVTAAAELECEIVNTVFFEGIPTLSQYGMAILALLMLGVGLIGFRRWV